MPAAQQAAAVSSMQPSCSSRFQAHNAPAAGRSANIRPCTALPPRTQRATRLIVKRRLGDRQVSCATSSQEVGKLISRVEIPAFIPRQDLMDQLARWAVIEVQENGVANLGMPTKVTPVRREGMLWGFTVSFLKDGVSATDVRVAFDEETTLKYEWVGRGADGFPALEGNSEEVLGKHFEIRKIDTKPVNEGIRSAIRDFCQMLVGAINKYYAFGSAFVDDST